MGRHRLPTGREVFLSRFCIAPTYDGVLEGHPETASRYILERVADDAARILPPAVPLVVLPPPSLPLPEWLCVAELGSHRGARQNDPAYFSRLYVGWFADGTAQSIDELVAAILPLLDWEQAAEDYDAGDF